MPYGSRTLTFSISLLSNWNEMEPKSLKCIFPVILQMTFLPFFFLIYFLFFLIFKVIALLRHLAEAVEEKVVTLGSLCVGGGVLRYIAIMNAIFSAQRLQVPHSQNPPPLTPFSRFQISGLGWFGAPCASICLGGLSSSSSMEIVRCCASEACFMFCLFLLKI